MVQRTVSVGLVANVNNYVAGMAKAEAATKKTAAAAVGSEKQLRAQGEAFTKVGALAMGAGAVAAAGLALVVKASAEFGAKMAQLQTLSHASGDEMKKLSDAAMSAGAAYGYSATQVADAEIELTKAGVSVSAQLGGALKGALSLAAAGQLDVAQATEITTVAMTQFGLSAKDVPHVADLLSAGADKALGSVGDLGEALKNGGLQAHNMGLTIDDTVGLLSGFANAGILGAEAGTQMRSMFLRLENPTTAAKNALDKYGISINDASGKFVGITKFSGELRDQLDKLTPANRNAALATIFGSHAIVGATALYNLGAKGVQGWINSVNDAGFANAQASGKLNSLTGDVQKLSAAFQTDLIKAGTDASGSLRGVVQSATGLLDFLGGLPQPLKDAGVEMTVVVAGVGLLGGAALIAVPKVLAFKTAMSEAGVSARSFGGIVGKGGVVIAGLSAIAAGLSAMGQVGTASTQQIEQAGIGIQHGWKGVDTVFKSAGSALDSGKGLKASLDELGNGGAFASAAGPKFIDAATSMLTFGLAGTHLADVYKTNEGTFAAMGQQLAGLAKTNYSAASSSFASLVSKYHLGADETKNLLRTMPAYREELVALAGKAHVAATDQNLVNIAQGKGAAAARVSAAAARDAASAAAKQASELGQLTGSGNAATTSVKNLHDALAGLGSTELDARSAARAFQQAIDDATTAANKNGRSLDINTQAGRDNQQALDAVASSARDSAAAYVSNGGSAKGAAAIIANGRAAYIKAAESMGLSKSAANKLADALHLIPSDVNTIIKVTGGGDAAAKIAAIKSAMNNLQGTTADVYIQARTVGLTDAQASQIARNAKFADGGAVGGSGPKGVDSVPAVLAPGEHVLTASDVDKMGGQSGVYAFRNALHMAAGGAVGEAQRAGSRDRSQAATYRASLAKAKRDLKAATHHADTADSAYQKAATAAQNIYGKGTTAKKHEAEVHARHLKATAAQAKAAEAREQKRVDALQKQIDTADQKAQTEAAKYTNDSQASEDFVSAQRRDPNPDPLSYVDQLRSMSRDTADYGPKRRASFDKAANTFEAALVSLATKSAAAAQKLSDLTSASDQMKSSIASAIAGGYQASSVPLTGAHDASTRNVASGWITRNGIRMQNYRTVDVAASAGKITAGGLASYYSGGAKDTKAFAAQLKALAARKVNPALLAEIAGYGVAQGAPIAAALLSATGGQLASINAGYKAIQTNAATAGTTVANDNYAALIRSAQTNADNITKQIASDSEKLRKLIASAFGLKGYAVGTTSASPGLHLVGERGPELLRFRGGEQVYTAGQTRAYIRGSSRAGGGQQIVVQAPQVVMPDTITVQDASGFTTTMRVVAHEVVNARHEQIAVHLMGAAS